MSKELFGYLWFGFIIVFGIITFLTSRDLKYGLAMTWVVYVFWVVVVGLILSQFIK